MPTFTPLPHLSILRLSGADTEPFLQGQLSNDLAEHRPGQAQLQAYCNPKGRVIAVCWLLRQEEDYLLVLPQGLSEAVAKRLRMYVLRAEVQIETLDEPPIGLWDAPELPPAQAPSLIPDNAAPPRSLALGPPPDVSEADAQTWRLADIHAGIGFVYPETREEHLAQALNLDANRGLSFTKGCFPGQEIIARLRYLGRAKHRMRRAAAPCPPPAPGSPVAAPDHTGQVIEAAATEKGCELLFIAPVAAPEAGWQIDGHALEILPLPYEIPKDRKAAKPSRSDRSD